MTTDVQIADHEAAFLADIAQSVRHTATVDA